jgi:splicing factor U2AF subunit
MCNMVTADEISDESEFVDILADVSEECTKYGAVRRVTIPRPKDLAAGLCESDDVCQVFVEFEGIESAQRAISAVSGRRFSGRTINCSYIPTDVWIKKQRMFDQAGKL